MRKNKNDSFLVFFLNLIYGVKTYLFNFFLDTKIMLEPNGVGCLFISFYLFLLVHY